MLELRHCFPGDARQISDMREFARTGCQRIWERAEDSEAISQLELAVSELASNILLHGLHGDCDATIELVMMVANDRVDVTFLYPGCAFTPQAVPAPDFSGRAESGYGLYLIQQSVDELHFARDNAGLCRIHFIKYRH